MTRLDDEQRDMLTTDTTTSSSQTASAADAFGFEPVATELRYGAPTRSIDPDRSKGWMRRLLPVVLSHKVIFLSAMVGTLVSVVAKVIFPRITGDAIDEALVGVGGVREPLAGYLIVMAVLATIAFVAGMVARYNLFRSGFALEFDLRTLMYQQFTRLSFPYYDRVQSGQLISRANSDIRAVQMFLAFAPFIALQFVMFFVGLYFMLQISGLLTVLAIAVLPVTFIVGIRMRQEMFPVSWLMQARMADVATVVDENVNGVRVVKSFAAEERQIEALSRSAKALEWASVKQIDIRAKYAPLMENAPRFGEALILLYGGFLVVDGQIGPGDIVVFMAYLVMLQVPFRMVGFLVMMAQRAAAASVRIYDVLDEVPDIQDRPGAYDLTDVEGRVELRDVTFGYGAGAPVLDHLDLTVDAGQTVALVGRTGSGKTTLAQLVPRFYDVVDGALLIDGHDVRDITLRSLRSHVGVCFDEPFLFSVSVRDNIAFGRPDATDEEIVAAARIAGADEFIRRLDEGYDTVVGERGYTLSGGQRQRIAIARTIVENPKVLILDDATSAIDVRVELAIHGALRNLLAGRTTLIVAHRLSTISLADRVVYLEDGVIAADGTHEELMRTEPRYRAVLAHMEEEELAAQRAAAEEVLARTVAEADEGGDH